MTITRSSIKTVTVYTSLKYTTLKSFRKFIPPNTRVAIFDRHRIGSTYNNSIFDQRDFYLLLDFFFFFYSSSFREYYLCSGLRRSFVLLLLNFPRYMKSFSVFRTAVLSFISCNLLLPFLPIYIQFLCTGCAVQFSRVFVRCSS